MNKRVIFLIIIVAIASLLLVFLRGDEDSWICVNGEWTKHGNPAVEKPLNSCTK